MHDNIYTKIWEWFKLTKTPGHNSVSRSQVRAKKLHNVFKILVLFIIPPLQKNALPFYDMYILDFNFRIIVRYCM